MIRPLTRFITTLSASPVARCLVLAGYYLLILAGVFGLATSGAFATPTFVYQGF